MILNGLSDLPKRVVILGSTGSIGRQSLEVIATYPDKFKVVGLAAYNEIDEIADQANRWNCPHIAIADGQLLPELKQRLRPGIKAAAGIAAICELAAMTEADLIISAISGAAGILPTITALENNKPVALANKETLVAAGDIVMALARQNNLPIFPIDSEHSAVWQCLKGESANIKKIWLTASGGPFRGYSRTELDKVTPAMALQHPSWRMGPKITVDSATLINKGLEIIEAHHLFNLGYDYIDAIICPGSMVHALVEMVDGSFIAHMGPPDMRIPIQYALSYPERWPLSIKPLPLTEVGPISFHTPDYDNFPGLRLAINAGKNGGTMPAVMNAANEEAVAYFLHGNIGFNQIPEIIGEVMARHLNKSQPSLDEILQADEWARMVTKQLVEG